MHGAHKVGLETNINRAQCLYWHRVNVTTQMHRPVPLLWLKNTLNEVYTHSNFFCFRDTAIFADIWNITTYAKSFHIPLQIPLPLPSYWLRLGVFLRASSGLLSSPTQSLTEKMAHAYMQAHTEDRGVTAVHRIFLGMDSNKETGQTACSG